MGLKRKKLLKQGACIAVCSTMLATGVTQLIPAYQAQSLVCDQAYGMSERDV